MTLFAAVPCWLDEPRAGLVRHVDWNGVERRIHAQDVELLARCDEFRSRDAHVGDLERAGVRNAAAQFDRLLAAGLVADAATMLRPARPAAPSLPSASPLLVVRSYERPVGLRRLLDSLRRDGERWGIAHEVVVVDDTRDPAQGEATRAIVAAFARGRGARTWLLGPAERGRAFAALESSVPGARALRELLDPGLPSAVTGSRTWNWAVLLAAGRTLSILDDDTSFPLRRFAADDARVELADSTEAVVRFFDDSSWADAEALSGEPYAALAEWLGRDCVDLLAAHGWREDALPFRRPDELAHLRGGHRVAGVVPGLYGSIALDSSAYLLHSNPPTQASLFRTPYRHGRLAADAVHHGYPQPRLTSHAVYTPLLLDDRELLPFAGTWGRVDDTYFLALLKAIEPHVAFAHVPAMLGHSDVAPRRRLERAVDAYPLDRNTLLARMFFGDWPGTDRESRLRSVGARCAVVAGDDDDLLPRFAATHRQSMLGRIVEQLELGLANHPGAPEP
ncbi:MAG TPA: hypothetical protein VFL14_02155, partial [Xanthomonadales bacterium]|nr:hypothetical protein [Xanthomonadales bacterium]